jgi:hypothetical protein
MQHKNPRIRLLAAKLILDKTIPNASVTRRVRRRTVRGEPGIPIEFVQAAYNDQQQEPEDRVADNDTWHDALAAIRVQNARAVVGEYNRLQPLLAEK